MQALISRFGGMPATILKFLLLGLVNAMALWALPTLIETQSWAMLVVLVLSVLALDLVFLMRGAVPPKYFVVGAIFLTVFQLIPIGYTVSVAFTNYSTGHMGTKEEAITAIERDTLTQAPDAKAYDMLAANDSSGELVLILTEQVVVTTPTEETDTTTTDPVTEFGPSESAAPETVTEFGPGAETPTASATAEIPADVAVAPAAPTFIGTPDALTPVPSSDVQTDELGLVTGVTGYTVVANDQLVSIQDELEAYQVPGPAGGLIVPQGLALAVELTPVVVYDAATDTFTDQSTGAVYTDNGRGSFTVPGNDEDELLPGWKEGVGFSNFTQILNDPEIRQPFIAVFIWTFVFAIGTVAISFFIGLGLALVLNDARMRGQRVYRSLLVIPYAIPAFLSILVFAGLLNDDFGAINNMFGINVPWLFDPTWAKVSCILVNVWLGVPYMFLVATGALQSIPSELQEAARVDGARSWQIFRRVNLPLLLIALTPLLVASFAFNFNNFNLIWLFTGGGPGIEGSPIAGATDILITYTYKIAFASGKGNNYGLASALSIIIFFIVGTISAISFARSKALREDHR